METDLYRKLQLQLDQYSMGFPATTSGVEIKILKKLFSEADARLFLQMTPLLEAPADIAARLDSPVDEITTKPEKQVKTPPVNAFEQMMQMAQKRGVL
jgi:electron transport complex protein RnfB